MVGAAGSVHWALQGRRLQQTVCGVLCFEHVDSWIDVVQQGGGGEGNGERVGK